MKRELAAFSSGLLVALVLGVFAGSAAASYVPTWAALLKSGAATGGTNPSISSGDKIVAVAAAQISFQMTPLDASTKLFNIGTGDFANASGTRHDDTLTFAYNIDPTTGGKQSSGDNAQGLVFETYYNPSGSPQTEAYLNIIFPSSSNQYRPFSYVGLLDGSETVNATISGSKISFLTKDSATTVMSVQPNATASSSVWDLEGVLENDTNNVIWLKQKNAAANAFIPLIYLDSTDIIRLDPNFKGLQIGGNSRFYVDSNGNVITRNSSSLATNATNGWLYIPQSQGTPTGAPAALPSGDVPIQWDFLGHQIWAYDQNSATGWLHCPATIGEGRVTGQTGAATVMSSLTLNAQDCTVQINANVLITAFTAGTLSMTVSYKSEDNVSQTLTLNFSSLGGTLATTCGAAAAFEGVPLTLRCKASTTITIQTTVNVFTGTYNAEAHVTQLK